MSIADESVDLVYLGPPVQLQPQLLCDLRKACGYGCRRTSRRLTTRRSPAIMYEQYALGGSSRPRARPRPPSRPRVRAARSRRASRPCRTAPRRRPHTARRERRHSFPGQHGSPAGRASLILKPAPTVSQTAPLRFTTSSYPCTVQSAKERVHPGTPAESAAAPRRDERRGHTVQNWTI